MTLTISVVGFAVLRLTDADHIRVQPVLWFTSHVLAAWGMLLCLRGRLPQKYPAPSDAIDLQNWLNDYEQWHQANPEGLNLADAASLQVGKLHAYTSVVSKLISDWKAQCIRGAGGLLMLSFLAVSFSFWVPTWSSQSGTASQQVDGDGGLGGSRVPTSIPSGDDTPSTSFDGADETATLTPVVD